MSTTVDSSTRAPETQAPKAKRQISDRVRAERKLGWLLAGPAFVIMLLVTLYPIVQALYDSLQSNAWSWPRNTNRVNGTVAGTTRDIYDTGGLYASQKLKTSHQVTQSKLTVTYLAPYASLVHYGGYVQPYGNKNANTVLIPARPWVEAVLNGTHGQKKIDLSKILLDTITEGLGEFVI